MILLELSPTDKAHIEAEIKESTLDAQVLEKKNFNGQTEILEVLIVLSTSALPIIAKLIIERIRSRKHIEVKYKGLTIKGLSEKNTIDILGKLIEKGK